MKSISVTKRSNISRWGIPLIPLLLLCFLEQAFAFVEMSENHSLSVPISELRAPVSPAFQLLYKSPAVITRPQTPRAVLVSLTDAIQNLGDANIAMEFSPYWIFSHPEISFEDYYNPSPENSLLMNSSLSVGFDNQIDSLGSKMAVGFRTVVFPGSPGMLIKNINTRFFQITLASEILGMCWYDINEHLEDVNCINRLRNAVIIHCEQFRQNPKIHTDLIGQDLMEAIDEAENLILGFIDEASSDSGVPMDSVYNNAMKMADAQEEVLIQILSAEVEDADLSRNGFLLEVAGASASRFQDNRFGNHEFTSCAAWITPGYASNSLEFLGVFRVIRELDLEQTYLDCGIRAGISSRFFTLSAEGLLRRGDGESYRIATSAEVKISEDLYASIVFGKDFSSEEDEGDLLSLLRLDYNLSGLTRILME
ncbi:MAG: hypothetical protein K8S62_07085 [Candidatus Sabulitectum sp.]|nr:hypothetical protein [Candidatus Sabulitectum sp.]